MGVTTAIDSAPKHIPLYGLLAAILISSTGNAITALAIPWYVLATTGSPARTGLAAFFGTLPLVLSAFFGGVLVDRLGFKKIAVLADVLSGLSVAAIPLLDATIGLPFWALLALVFLGALFDASGNTGRTALIVGLAEPARMPVERVNSLEEIALNLPLLVGPPLAGVLVAVTDPSRVLWIDAASFAISASIVALLVPTTTAGHERQRTSYLRDLAEGIRFVWRERVIGRLIVLTAVLTLLVAPIPSVLLPVYVRETYGSALSLGLLIASFGVGMLLGVIGYGTVGHRLPRRAVLVVSIAGLAAMAFIFAASPSWEALLGAAVVGGIAYGPFGPLAQAVATERTPEVMRGRVFGLAGSVGTVTTPVAVLLVGFGLQSFGVREFVLAIGLCLLLVAVGIAVNKTLGMLDSTKSSRGAIT